MRWPISVRSPTLHGQAAPRLVSAGHVTYLALVHPKHCERDAHAPLVPVLCHADFHGDGARSTWIVPHSRHFLIRGKLSRQRRLCKPTAL